MPDGKQTVTNRRPVLKKLGASGTLGIVALAGCSGDGGDDGSDGNDGSDGSDGSGGDGSNGGDGGDGDSGGTLTVRAFPISEFGIRHHCMADTGILQEELDKVGWDLDMEFVFQNLPPFVSGEADVVDMGALEIGRVSQNNNIDLAVTSMSSCTLTGAAVKKGGPYDPANTGSRQASVDKLVNDGDRLAIFSWGSGNTPPQQVIFPELFGYDMRQEGGDITVVTAQPPSIPKLLRDEQVGIALTSPLHGGGTAFYNDEIVPLWWDNVITVENDLGRPHYTNIVFRQDFVRENPGPVKAYHRAQQRCNEWFNSEDGGISEIPDPEMTYNGEDNWFSLLPNVTDPEVAQWCMDWSTAHLRGMVDDVKHANNAPKVFNDTVIDQDFIDLDQKFFSSGVRNGIIEEGARSRAKYVPVTGDSVPPESEWI